MYKEKLYISFKLFQRSARVQFSELTYYIVSKLHLSTVPYLITAQLYCLATLMIHLLPH